MSDMELLLECRRLAQEAALLEHQLGPEGALEEETEPKLRQLLENNRRARADLSPGLEKVIRCSPSGRQRQILRQYYSLGLTDVSIAASMGCSRKAVNKQRNAFVRGVVQA